MRKVIFIIFICFGFLKTYTQQDSEAKKILDQASERTKSFNTIQVNFNLTINDRKEKTNSSSKGTLKIKGDMYRMDMENTIILFDGKTMWTISTDIKEVTINEPDMEDDDFLSNPAKILTWYNRDFKYRYVQNTTVKDVAMHEIDLFPVNLEQPYSRIKVFISVKDLLLNSVISVGKDGIDYTVNLSDYITNKELDDSIFKFDPQKYKKFEIVDMRI